MNDTELERLRRQFGSEEKITPPEDLLARLKSDIPEGESLRRHEEERGTGLSDHPAAWRLAASVLMLFGFAFVAARIYLESRHDRYASYPATYAAPVATRNAADQGTVDETKTQQTVTEAPQLQAEAAPVDALSRAKKESVPASPRPQSFTQSHEQIAANELPSLAKTNERGGVEGAVASSAARDREFEDDARLDRPASKPEESFAPEPPPVVTAEAPVAPAAPAAAAIGGTRAEAQPQQAKAARTLTTRQAAPVKQDEQVYRLGGDVHPPKLESESPVVVTEAERKSLSGKLTVDLVVKSDGTVDNVRIVEAPDVLRDRLLASVRLRRYRPGTLHGHAVSVEIRTNVPIVVR
jgi:hypothetical protein